MFEHIVSLAIPLAHTQPNMTLFDHNVQKEIVSQWNMVSFLTFHSYKEIDPCFHETKLNFFLYSLIIYFSVINGACVMWVRTVGGTAAVSRRRQSVMVGTD